MDHFNYRDNILYAEDISVPDLIKKVGTPCYIYSKATLERHYKVFDEAFGDWPHKICYAVKANSNLAVLSVLAKLGSGFDIVSGGELKRLLAIKADTKKIVFSGVGKTKDEIELALANNIYCFNVESKQELDHINAVAKKLNKKAPISLRINPNIDAKTHPYISTGLYENKFGIPFESALDIYQYANTKSHLQIKGIDCHIGSQLTEITPFIDALKSLLKLIDELQKQNIIIKHIDVGGGLGVVYNAEKPPAPKDQIGAILAELKGRNVEVIIEPGRAIVANAGILVTEVLITKETKLKNFAVVDAGMNDLLRPALYGAWQSIIPVIKNNKPTKIYDIVGPVCETGDFLGKDRELSLQPEDLLAVRSAGAYGFVMSSNYNSRPRACEVMVDGSHFKVVRARETYDDLFDKEKIF